ncbi:hypothetical protein L1987_00467 [Smallanthus sonchifolius]|uniref:Uncharacterized protein n=1 Tax=Smallanthus sonchifolius TaxID=185202 RepID=A0ACB9K2C5_9ASTR|nr:hypothetical protein L1987_00467 [Smallanthus sonchifolius]
MRERENDAAMSASARRFRRCGGLWFMSIIKIGWNWNWFMIEAHGGSVSDLAFSYPNKKLCIVTCSEDRSIKEWDAVTEAKLYTFEGHEAYVYSVCSHFKEPIQFIFSIATDGKIKPWLYDNMGARVDHDAPGHSSTTMAYSADGTRFM